MPPGDYILDANELMAQATKTAATYMNVAADHVEEKFGKGAATANPALVAAFMQAAAADFHTMFLAQRMEDLQESLGEIADALADS